MTTPLVLGMGGTTRVGSTSERALRLALDAAAAAGARTRLIGGAALAAIPMYVPDRPHRAAPARELVEAVRHADGLIIATPAYHGGVSGLVKNALDYLEDLRADDPPYLSGRPVGCIVTAEGWQTCATALVALRSIVHALRAWPTPLGVTLSTAEPVFDAEGACTHARAARDLATVGGQVAELAHRGG